MSNGSETPSRPPSNFSIATQESDIGSINISNISLVRSQLLAHLGSDCEIMKSRIELSNGKTIHIKREYDDFKSMNMPYDPVDDIYLKRLEKSIRELLITDEGFEILGMYGEEEVVICVDTKPFSFPNPNIPPSKTRKKILTGRSPIEKN